MMRVTPIIVGINCRVLRIKYASIETPQSAATSRAEGMRMALEETAVTDVGTSAASSAGRCF
jgi:hypothetical protein